MMMRTEIHMTMALEGKVVRRMMITGALKKVQRRLEGEEKKI
jgi:hypothetical protein